MYLNRGHYDKASYSDGYKARTASSLTVIEVDT